MSSALPDHFCQSCATKLAEGVIVCPACGSPVPGPSASSDGVSFADNATVPRRPAATRGVTCLGSLVGFQGVSVILAFFFALNTGNVLGLLILGVLGAATSLLAWGLWTLRPWAFWSGIVIELIYLTLALWNWWELTIRDEATNSTSLPIVLAFVVLIGVLSSRRTIQGKPM